MYGLITWIFPRTPVLSILLATFTVFPQISYCGFWAPMTPAITGPWLMPDKGHQAISKYFTWICNIFTESHFQILGFWPEWDITVHRTVVFAAHLNISNDSKWHWFTMLKMCCVICVTKIFLFLHTAQLNQGSKAVRDCCSLNKQSFSQHLIRSGSGN